jgi:aubergine-like protein
MELISTRKSDNAQIKIIIRFVRSILREEPHYIVFFNIVMRKCLEYLELQLVGRNYYDTRNKVSRNLYISTFYYDQRCNNHF